MSSSDIVRALLIVSLIVGVSFALYKSYERGLLGGKPALQTRLFVAIWRNELTNVETDLRKGADYDAPSVQLTRPTPLIDACRLGDLAIVRVLLDYGANPNKTDRDGHGPIYYTLTSGLLGGRNDYVSGKIVKLLLEHGVSKSGKDLSEAVTSLSVDDPRRVAWEQNSKKTENSSHRP
jgi:ankyrin repeat protein